MRKIALLATLAAGLAPIGREDIEMREAGVASAALAYLPTASLHPAVACFALAVCGVFLVKRPRV